MPEEEKRVTFKDALPTKTVRTSKRVTTSYSESFQSSSSKAKDTVLVIFGSLIEVKGATLVTGNADKNHCVIQSNLGSMTITEPGNYILAQDSNGFKKRSMSQEEYDRLYSKLSSSDRHKLRREKDD